MPASATSLIDTVLAADTERASLLAEAETATDPHRIAEVQTRLADIDAWSAEARAASILKGLGFDAKPSSAALLGLSPAAGACAWRWRACSSPQPDLLLLDEPTNYLDLEGALWLESYLAKYPHTVMIISHDRGLLNRAVTGILHLDNKKLTYWTGPYDSSPARRRTPRRLAGRGRRSKTPAARICKASSTASRPRPPRPCRPSPASRCSKR